MTGPGPWHRKNLDSGKTIGSAKMCSGLNILKVDDSLERQAHKDLEGLMRSLDGLHLSPSVPDARFWSLSSSGLFSINSFFLALSQFSRSPQVFPSKFIWNSQVPFKVKSFVCMGNQQIIFFFIVP
ncbi:hypothetical protein CK203_031167 [Vitis vinifera]|uniref:Uncharacterized protein n=1 Tax=Vitis vinifera TaxID=29760 RepID=A0A438J0E8_VITVI|nr:hypothetical protein CK203_031167 [Vitis vinifera]